jgi:sugar phosphate isomerase/epimerase
MRTMKNLVSRRSVLRASAAISAYPLLAPFASAAGVKPATPSPIRLGIASYTFRKFDSAHLIDFMHQLKTPYLNLKDVHLPMKPAEDVKAKADAYRAAGFILTAAGTITFAKPDEDDIRAKFDYVKAAGIPIIVGSPSREALPIVEKYVKQYNIKLAIHNHGPEDPFKWHSPLDILEVVKSMDPRIGCCLDIGHCTRAGVDPVKAVHAAGPRLFDMHTKDLANSTERDSQVAVGEGIIQIHEIFKALIAIKYAGNVDLEYEIHENDPMPGVIESFAYMRGILSGMGYDWHTPITPS